MAFINKQWTHSSGVFLATCLMLLSNRGINAQEGDRKNEQTVNGRGVAGRLRMIADYVEAAIPNKNAVQYYEAIQTGLLVLRENDKHPEFRFTFVPSGTFQLGMTEEERQANIVRFAKESTRISTTLGFDSVPKAFISVRRGYFILQNEVTRRQFDAILKIQQKKRPRQPT